MNYFEVNMLKDGKCLMSFREEGRGPAFKLKRILQDEGYDTEILELSDNPLFESVPDSPLWTGDEEIFDRRY